MYIWGMATPLYFIYISSIFVCILGNFYNIKFIMALQSAFCVSRPLPVFCFDLQP